MVLIYNMNQNQYYEGILQLRNPSKEVIERIKGLIQKRKDVYIAKEEKVKGGIDFYISDWKYLIDIGNKLQKRFGGEIKTSRKLWGVNRQTSRKVYRVVVLLRLPIVKIGDIVEFRGKKIKILEFRKRISAADTETGKRMLIKYEEI
jgi:NMD protein affecting ribosome stability and mRNA decay